MKRLTCLIVLFLLVGMAPIAWAGAKEEVEEAISGRIKAIEAGNPEAVASFYAKDARYFGTSSPFRLEGRKAIQAAYAGLARAFPIVRVSGIHHNSIQIYNGTTAVSSAYYTATLVNKAGKATRIRGRATFTRIKMGGRWLVVQQHLSVLPASR